MRTGAIAIFLTAAAIAGCADQPTAPGRPTVSLSVAAKGQSVLLAVTVDDAGPSGAYRIRSDGQGEYVHGLKGMSAEIDGVGNLLFSPENLQLSTPPQRTLTFDFNAPTDPLNTYRPDESGQRNFRFLTGSTSGSPRIQDLGVNGNPVSACYAVSVAHQNTVNAITVRFNNPLYPPSVNVYITRTAVSPGAWTMVSNGPCAGTANWGAVWSQDLTGKNKPVIYRGTYDLQFSLYLRAI